MMKEMLFDELRHYVACWESEQKDPASAYGILRCIGYLRRQWIEKDELTILRKVELMARKDIDNIAQNYNVFMQKAFLHRHAKALDKSLDEDTVDIFLQFRDESQMAFEIFQEYVGEENYPTPILKTIRDYHLLQVDRVVLWDKPKVKAIQSLVFYTPTPPALDTEIFWWWSKSAHQEDHCWLPGYFRDHCIAASLDNVLDQQQEEHLQSHLQICPDCQLQYNMTKSMIEEAQNQHDDIVSLNSDEMLQAEVFYSQRQYDNTSAMLNNIDKISCSVKLNQVLSKVETQNIEAIQKTKAKVQVLCHQDENERRGEARHRWSRVMKMASAVVILLAVVSVVVGLFQAEIKRQEEIRQAEIKRQLPLLLCHAPLLKNLSNESWYIYERNILLDITTDFWHQLTAKQQSEYASAYQKAYCKMKGLPIEKEIPLRGLPSSAKPIILRLIPPGRFCIGENKSFPVIISSAYYLSKYECTQDQWQAVMGSNPSYFKNADQNTPVEGVSWEDIMEGANSFCSKTSLQLPTKNQWEYACQAGTTSEYYSDNVDSIAWYDKNSGGQTHPVGQKKPNGFGLYDMLGNVLEWYKNDGTYHLCGGGSWNMASDYLSLNYEVQCDPHERNSYLGFRIVENLDQKSINKDGTY